MANIASAVPTITTFIGYCFEMATSNPYIATFFALTLLGAVAGLLVTFRRSR